MTNTPTPAVSHAILCHNRGRTQGLADGIVITRRTTRRKAVASQPAQWRPADSDVTKWIEAKANDLLAANLAGVKRMDHAQALQAATTQRHDYVSHYVADLENVIDFDVIRAAKLRGRRPLGGAGCVTGRRSPSITNSTWKW